jgi:NarL family two-component system response regulator LiaR
MIVDDHPSIRMGLELLLSRFDDIDVAGIAHSGTHALALCQEIDFDVALVDMCMPDMNGLDTIRALRKEFPHMKCLVFTQSVDDGTVVEALQVGAIGYLIKNAEIRMIADAIRAAFQNQCTLSPEALDAVIRYNATPNIHPHDLLTERELTVLELMAIGMKNPQIADELTITVSTVKFHVSSIFQKLRVRTRTEAVVAAIDANVIEKSYDG